MTEANTYSGYIAIVGRPNVGKSTLLNSLLGEKVSIISRKAQTTRQSILGIKTLPPYQLIFVDTPGWQQHTPHGINRAMAQSVKEAMRDVDSILFLVDKGKWLEADEVILKQLAKVNKPIIVAMNKIDYVKNKYQLLPAMERIQERCQTYSIEPKAIIPISAKQHQGLENLSKQLQSTLPASPYLFPVEQRHMNDTHFWAAEIIREKLMRLLGDEVPHNLAVSIEHFQETEPLIRIHALIWVARKGQKAIVIGHDGEVLKKVGYLARQDIESHWQKKVFLQLWVKIKKDWMDNTQVLRQWGYKV
jgi:GTP-binding protein Era